MELTWRKSSHSDNLGGNCIEVAPLSQAVGVRDSKNPDGPKLVLKLSVFRTLIGELKQA
jgi:hypothetical protein